MVRKAFSLYPPSPLELPSCILALKSLSLILVMMCFEAISLGCVPFRGTRYIVEI